MHLLKKGYKANYKIQIPDLMSRVTVGQHEDISKNDRNGGIWQSRISKSLVEYVQGRVCFVNVQLSLNENVVFSVFACVGNAEYIIFIMWNSISGLDAGYHFQFNITCGLAVMGRIHKNI